MKVPHAFRRNVQFAGLISIAGDDVAALLAEFSDEVQP